MLYALSMSEGPYPLTATAGFTPSGTAATTPVVLRSAKHANSPGSGSAQVRTNSPIGTGSCGPAAAPPPASEPASAQSATTISACSGRSRPDERRHRRENPLVINVPFWLVERFASRPQTWMPNTVVGRFRLPKPGVNRPERGATPRLDAVDDGRHVVAAVTRGDRPVVRLERRARDRQVARRGLDREREILAAELEREVRGEVAARHRTPSRLGVRAVGRAALDRVEERGGLDPELACEHERLSERGQRQQDVRVADD